MVDNSILINENDILEIAEFFKCDFLDENRKKTLLSTNSIDVQACPGSGKTTLLVAKLAILSKRWPWKDRGICVLSHTNVARREVQKRLYDHPTGYRLLRYPHFIGTIQSLVDSYLALPYLRSKGICVTAIDDGVYKKFLNSYYFADPYVLQYVRYKGSMAANSLHYKGVDMTLYAKTSHNDKMFTSQFDKNIIKHPQIYEVLSKFKKFTCIKQGIFCYSDMYGFAERYIDRNPFVINAIRYRFPIVFIDEMQDTDATQDNLLCSLFQNDCICQRFGDINQAIFKNGGSTESQNSFPVKNAIDLPTSKRFNNSIARFASKFTVHEQILIGNDKRPSKLNTIILFDEQCIEKVLVRYAHLIIKHYNNMLPDNFSAIAVGAIKKRKTENEENKKFPLNLNAYWPEYDSGYSMNVEKINTFLSFVCEARASVKEQMELKDANSIFLKGIIELLRVANIKDSHRDVFTKASLKSIFSESEEFNESLFNELKREILLRDNLDDVVWNKLVLKLFNALYCFQIDANRKPVKVFLSWNQEVFDLYKNRYKCTNIFHHSGVDIKVGTIHSVKGETHSAVLILETFNHSHDIKNVIKLLIKRPTKITKTLETHMKRLYVGVTRPSEMLCIALKKTHIDSDTLNFFDDHGWNIIDLTV